MEEIPCRSAKSYTMAQSHIEPIVVETEFTYTELDIYQDFTKETVLKEFISHILNLDSMKDYLMKSEELQFLKIEDTKVDQPGSTFTVQFCMYGESQFSLYLNLIDSNSNCLADFFKNYIKENTSSLKNINVATTGSRRMDKRDRVEQHLKDDDPLTKDIIASPTKESSTKKKQGGLKTFCLYIPSNLSDRVVKVQIVTQNRDQTSEKVYNVYLLQHQEIKDLWIRTISISEKDKQNVYYKYCMKLEGVKQSLFRGSFTGATFFESSQTEETEIKFRYSSGMETERDILKSDDAELSEGISIHLQHILQEARNVELEESVNQIDRLKGVRHLTIAGAQQVAKSCIKLISKFSKKEKLLFIVFLSRLPNDSYKLSNPVSKQLLEAFKGEDFIEFDIERKYILCPEIIRLCRFVFGDCTSFVHLVHQAYPFLHEKVLIGVFNNREEHKLQLFPETLSATYKETWEKNIIDAIITICVRLKDNPNEKETVLNFLQIFLTCLPYQQTIKCVIQIEIEYQKKIKNIPHFKALKQILTGKYRRIIENRETDVSTLSSLWRKMDDMSKESLQNEMEHSIQRCLEETECSNEEKTEQICRTIKQLCQEENFYRHQNAQISLLKTLCKTDNIRFQALFKDLIELDGFIINRESTQQQELILDWFTNEFNSICAEEKGMSPLIKAYHLLGGMISSVDIVKSCLELQSRLTEKVKVKISQQNLNETIVAIDAKWENEIAEQLFCKHLQELISRFPVERKEEIKFEPDADLKVHSSEKAGLIITLMEMEDISENMPAFEVVSKMLQNSKFWIAVINGKGTSMDAVHESNEFKLAIDAIHSLKEAFSTGDFVYQTLFFIKAIESKFHDFYDKILKRKNSVKKQYLDASKEMTAAFHKLHTIKENLDHIKRYLTGNVCTNFITNCDILNEQIQSTIGELSGSEIELQQALKQEVLCKERDFHSQSMWLKQAVESKVFIYVNKDIFGFENEGVRTFDEHDIYQNEDSVLPIINTLSSLATRGKEKYENVWKLFIDFPDVRVDAIPKAITDTGSRLEIQIATRLLDLQIDTNTISALEIYINLRKYKRKLLTIKHAIDVFSVDPNCNSKYINLYDKIENNTDLHLFEVAAILRTLYKTADSVSDDAEHTLYILYNGSLTRPFLEFIKKVMNEDMSNLADAVEEFSEQNISLATVLSLTEVQQFLQPVMKESFNGDIEKFLQTFEQSVKSTSMVKMNAHIVECLHNVYSLDYLYKNLANREERTREIIINIIQRGDFYFYLKYGVCTVCVKYTTESKPIFHSESKLQDLKSQALLIMNTEKKSRLVNHSSPSPDDHFETFLSVVESAFYIVDLCNDLHHSGHYHYQEFTKITKCNGLQDTVAKMENDLMEWNHLLKGIRQSHPHIITYMVI